MSYSLLAENPELCNEPELTEVPKRRCPLLKRSADLPEDDGDGRKTVALSTLGEKRVDMAVELDPNITSDGINTTNGLASNSATEKGNTKAKTSKRKSREQPLCMSMSRVSTRADTRKK